MSRAISVCCIAGILALAAGCSGGGKEPSLAPADGVVTYQGKPLASATVTFSPEGKGAPAMGMTDKEGKFRLTTNGRPGVSVGSAGVSVTVPITEKSEIDSGIAKQPRNAEEAEAYRKRASELQMEMAKKARSQGSPKKPESPIPEKYLKPETSGLVFTVKPNANDNHFVIELQ